ncbi:hypothetical protein KKG72_07080 [bacterium]|nr:hypothetical protein [bacterium]MBU1994014.1 hypothetical protein [bacterium]
MRFTLIKDLRQDATMKPILAGLLLFIFLFLLSDIFVKYSNFGIFPHALKLTLFGDEEQFLDPLSQSSFLEFWHVEIFFMMMILLTLNAVFIRLTPPDTSQIIVINLVMISAILSLISLPLSFFLSDSFIELYVVCFFTWHLFALYMALYSFWNLYYEKSI